MILRLVQIIFSTIMAQENPASPDVPVIPALPDTASGMTLKI